MGARFPGAADLDGYERLLAARQVAYTNVPEERWDHRFVHSPDRSAANRTPAQKAGFIDGMADFCPEYFGLAPKRARIMDPQQRLVLEASRQALDDAGYRKRHLGNGRTGVYIGATSADYRRFSSAPVGLPQILAGGIGTGLELSEIDVAQLSAAVPAISGYSIVGTQLNMIAANVSEAFDFTGAAFTVDTACSSGLVALHEAVGHLRSGQVDAALVGGVYVLLDPVMMVCFSRIGALSRTDKCLPFAAEANGFVLGEGVGMVVLKRLADAKRDGDPITAVIAGTAVNNDGKGGGAFTPLESGQRAVLAAAWNDADRDPSEVKYVEAHGTATPVGDRVELEAMSTHFGDAVQRGPVGLGAVKANIGHTVAAAGIASLIKAALSLREGRRYGEPHAQETRPLVAEAGFEMEVATRDWDRAGSVGVNAFGFGGTNAHVVMEAAPTARAESVNARSVVWEFSAPDDATLLTYLNTCYDALCRRRGWTSRGVAAVLDRRETHAVVCRLEGGDEAELERALQVACGREGEDAGGEHRKVLAGSEVWLPPLHLPETRHWAVDESKRRMVGRSSSSEAPIEAKIEGAAAGDRIELVWAALVEVTGRDRSDINLNLKLKQDLGFDSLMVLDFQNELGKRLGYDPDFGSSFKETDLRVAELIDQAEEWNEDDLADRAERTDIAKGDGRASTEADWMQWPEIVAAGARKQALEATGEEIPFFEVSELAGGGRSVVAGQELIGFSSYDYLGLGRDARVLEAMDVASKRWGASANASRIAAGERAVHGELEAELATFLGTQSCLTMVGGYGTNVAVIGHLLGPEDLLLHDKLAHECILSGGRLSGAKMLAFKHNDLADLERQLEKWGPQVRRILIAVEGVYSMDGDLVPLVEVVTLKKRFDALLLVDEAHSLGVVGDSGRGVAERFEVKRTDVDLWMGTLSKSLASCGGYLAGERGLIDYLRQTLPGFVFSVGMAPPLAAAGLAALRVLQAEPELVIKLRERSDWLRNEFKQLGLDTGTSADSAVVPWVLGNSRGAMQVAGALRKQGIQVHPIIAPAVDEAGARLRFFVTAAHRWEDLTETVAAVRRVLGETGTKNES